MADLSKSIMDQINGLRIEPTEADKQKLIGDWVKRAPNAEVKLNAWEYSEDHEYILSISNLIPEYDVLIIYRWQGAANYWEQISSEVVEQPTAYEPHPMYHPSED